MVRTPLLITALCLLFSTVSCTVIGVKKLEDQAGHFGFTPVQLSANGFKLGSFYRRPDTPGKRLHVYLEGDGRPWERGLLPASDPTTRSSVMLPLMAMDKAAVLYLGRPCYNGHAGDKGCSKTLWTSARYGELVVSTMSKALQAYCLQHGFSELVLMGHSGGGSLAILLAQRLLQTRAVVSLAANYDINAWADYHGYKRLTDSINPADSGSTGITEWHYLGERDINVPPALFFEALTKRQHSHVEIMPMIDHSHGWERIWPKILLQMANDV